ncbi:alpha/beta hydrolase [Priestia abyssalis]|uniref:alpha/beta hydrolase n=1 Tax=Priestia abyssalis TaxID=1221450 RepID=UPI0009959386|nr:alpha/beta fold hydrolase [Priestia abyssalis]
MELKAPEPFTFEKGERAVLLLHGFTGNTADVRMLGRFLEEKGYSSHAPLYKGHGNVSPEEFIKTGPSDWWSSVQEGYQLLKAKGYEKIAAAGISLGGVFSLKLAMEVPVVGVVPMCAPMGFKEKDTLEKMVRHYTAEYKKLEGKTEPEITCEVEGLQLKETNAVHGLTELVGKVAGQLHNVKAPAYIIQGRHDDIIDMKSPDMIYEHIQSEKKELNWYEQSGHVITLDQERNRVEEDVFQFLEKLDWEKDEPFIPLQETESPQIWW